MDAPTEPGLPAVPEALARLAVWLAAESAARPGLAQLCRDALAGAAGSLPDHPDTPALAAAIARFLPPAEVPPEPEPPPAPTLTGPDGELADRLRAAWGPGAEVLCSALLPPGPSAEEAAALAASALDGLVSAGLPAEQADAALSAVRAWAARFGLEVTPRAWTFAAPPALAGLPADEAAGVAAVFRGDAPKGTVYRVRTFGLVRGGEAVRACAASASAGPAPAGLGDLEEGIRGAEAGCWEEVRRRLRGWRQACLDDTLELAAVGLYTDFFGEFGDAARRDDPDRAAAFAEKLLGVMEQGFGLTAFRPKSYLDFPDGWMERASRRGMVSGRVTRVLRPGLKDAAGDLRVPALVEVE